ncbi:MAG TPA: DUF167 domain-containing protein [Labilithrix sp.]|jgi:uncharacterized protein (TIGR00251 family)|nr:DUF167 domain-containing protein [Labilithrix sp.]
MTIKLSDKDGSLRFEIHAKPRAKKSRIVGMRGDAVETALAAPPVDGAANEELVRFLAATLGVARRDVTIVRGETSQKKLVAVAREAGLTPEQALSRLFPNAEPAPKRED